MKIVTKREKTQLDGGPLLESNSNCRLTSWHCGKDVQLLGILAPTSFLNMPKYSNVQRFEAGVKKMLF